MSMQPERNFVDDLPTEQAVHDYLEQHPDFFEQHASLLSRLHLPHASGGTISLVERQVSVLRQTDLKLKRQLKELIEVARDNDVLAAKVHELSTQLLAAGSFAATVAVIEEAMRAGFSADHAVLVLFTVPDSVDEVAAGRFFRPIRRDDEGLKPFATFLESSAPRCGQVRDAQLDFMFHGDASEVGSVALLPLGRECQVGFLGIGSADGDRFHPGMSIDFLTRVADLVTAALSRY
ncbi:MAG: DUF484 family protein [Pseudomonadota bacterium]